MRKRNLLCGLAVFLAAAVPFTALASPDFAYSEERWAQLRDDKLEETK